MLGVLFRGGARRVCGWCDAVCSEVCGIHHEPCLAIYMLSDYTTSINHGGQTCTSMFRRELGLAAQFLPKGEIYPISLNVDAIQRLHLRRAKQWRPRAVHGCFIFIAVA